MSKNLNGKKAKIDRQTEEILQAAVSEVRLHACTNHTVVAQVWPEVAILGMYMYSLWRLKLIKMNS